MKTILIADDNSSLRQLAVQNLDAAGYRTVAVADGRQALAAFHNQTIDLAILDVMMPGIDGIETCRGIKYIADVPVLLLTAKSDIFDKQIGYEAGCDDYLTKPFDFRELLFRITALFKRYQTADQLNATIKVGQLQLDKRSYMIKFGSDDIVLPLKEFEVLYQLASHPQQIFTREDLITQIWGADYIGNDRTVDVHIKRLREHLPANTGVNIATVRGLGYQLLVDQGVSE